jgi:hypothetical protein
MGRHERRAAGSEWDECNFAIIHLTEDLKKEWAKRIEAAKYFKNDWNFQSLNYYDSAVDFYRIDKDDNPNIEELLSEREWVYVSLEDKEEATFTTPESRLDCYRLVIRSNGTAYYQAYGKHTGEEFYTEEFDLNIICATRKRNCKTRFIYQRIACANGMFTTLEYV